MLREKDKLLCLEIQEELGRYNPRPIYKYVKEDQKQVPVYMTDKEEIVAFLEKYILNLVLYELLYQGISSKFLQIYFL